MISCLLNDECISKVLEYVLLPDLAACWLAGKELSKVCGAVSHWLLGHAIVTQLLMYPGITLKDFKLFFTELACIGMYIKVKPTVETLEFSATGPDASKTITLSSPAVVFGTEWANLIAVNFYSKEGAESAVEFKSAYLLKTVTN
jgi:hypothetical protein